jgi:hypothetical protein
VRKTTKTCQDNPCAHTDSNRAPPARCERQVRKFVNFHPDVIATEHDAQQPRYRRACHDVPRPNSMKRSRPVSGIICRCRHYGRFKRPITIPDVYSIKAHIQVCDCVAIQYNRNNYEQQVHFQFQTFKEFTNRIECDRNAFGYKGKVKFALRDIRSVQRTRKSIARDRNSFTLRLCNEISSRM